MKKGIWVEASDRGGGKWCKWSMEPSDICRGARAGDMGDMGIYV